MVIRVPALIQPVDPRVSSQRPTGCWSASSVLWERQKKIHREEWCYGRKHYGGRMPKYMWDSMRHFIYTHGRWEIERGNNGKQEQHGEPFTVDPVTVSSEFFATTPPPCSRFSSIVFPCQKRVYRCSFGNPFSASLVSSKVSTSLFSLSSLSRWSVEKHSISQDTRFGHSSMLCEELASSLLSLVCLVVVCRSACWADAVSSIHR